MSQRVKVKVRANKPVQFPGLCVHCAQPAGAGRLSLRKRIGRITRRINVPLCLECHRQLNQLSSEEKRLKQISQIAGAVTLLLILAISMMLTPAGLQLFLRLLVSLFTALLLASIVLLMFRSAQDNAAPVSKKAIVSSASILAFTWRATIFEFNNATFTERFKRLNEPLLMDI